MNKPYRLYLFDVDGTLTDSAEDICGAIKAVLDRHGYPPQPFPLLRSYIGRHLTDLFVDVIPGITPERVEQLIADYRELYWAREHNSTRLFPGVAEAVPRLTGLKSTATTKGTPTTRIVLEKFGLLPYFDHVQGTDGFPAKPSPEVIQRSLQLFGINPADALMIGDAPADIAAARAAGVPVCAVTYGYGKRHEMEPDFWIDDLCELVA
jgi:phosphoglycolate phosphatase